MKKIKRLIGALLLSAVLVFPVYAATDVFSVHGTPGGTVRIAGTDASQTLSTVTGMVTSLAGKTPRAVLITCESFDMRISFVDTSVQTGSAEVGHVLAAGSSLWLNSYPAWANLKFINKTNGSNAILQVTWWY